MTMTESAPALKEGRVVGIAGPVVDVEFPRGALPEINMAVEFTVTSTGRRWRCWPRWHSSSAAAACGRSA